MIDGYTFDDVKNAWIDGFHYGADVASDLSGEAHRLCNEHWPESETFKEVSGD